MAINIIQASNFGVNPWQRGTTFAAVANGAYTADRFVTNYVSSAVVTISQQADSPTVAQAGLYSTSCARIAVTTADATIAAADYFTFSQSVEGYNFTPVAQQSFVCSFWVKASKVGVYCVSFTNSGADRSYVDEFVVNAANTWEYKRIIVSPSPTAGTWNYTNGVGLKVRFALAVGSNFQTTKGSWKTGNFMGTSSQVNALDSNTNTFNIQFIKIEPGVVATPFVTPLFGNVLSNCQRYYQKTFNQGITPVQASGTQVGVITYRATVAAATASGQLWPFEDTMRTTPVMTYYNPVSANALWYNVTLAADSGAASTISASDRGLYVGNAQVALDAVPNVISIHAAADAELL